jgi:hypothetical protein
MGLPGELDEIKKAWKNAPPIVKPWLILSAFLSFASIASLSQTVFEWKGFLLNAVLFYRESVSQPLAGTLQQWVHVSLPPSFFEAAAIWAVCGTALVRSFWFDARQTGTREDYFWAGVVTVIFAVGMTYQTIKAARAPASFTPNWYIILGTYVFLAALAVFHRRRAIAAYELLWFWYLVLPPALVAIIAAISEGLHRVA